METDSELSDQELDQIEARAAAATPGPWFPRFLNDSFASNLAAVSTEPDTGKHERLRENSSDLKQISKTLVAATLLQQPPRYLDIEDTRWNENAAFISAARTDVPRLVQELRRLRHTRKA